MESKADKSNSNITDIKVEIASIKTELKRIVDIVDKCNPLDLERRVKIIEDKGSPELILIKDQISTLQKFKDKFNLQYIMTFVLSTITVITFIATLIIKYENIAK